MEQIFLENAPEWIFPVIGVVSLIIGGGAVYYAEYCEEKYQTSKYPVNMVNVVVSLIGAVLIISSPNLINLLIGIGALVFLFFRNKTIIKQALPAALLSLLMFMGFVFLFWYLIYKIWKWTGRSA